MEGLRDSLTRRLRSTLGADSKSLSESSRTELKETLDQLNSLSLEALDLSWGALCLGKTPPAYDSRSPFRGLESFRPEDAAYFFGREALTKKLAQKLNEHNFLAVLGASGSGKSSLVMAGLIPALDVPYAIFRPGAEPLSELDKAVQAGPQLLVVDQFEELFTLSARKQRAEFISRLLEQSKRIRVVITLRADFLGEVAPFKSLKDEVQNHQEIIPPMDEAELRRAMEGQAACAGLRFESDLSQQMLVFARCSEFEKELLRDIFLRLTRLDADASADGRDTRRRVLLRDLIPADSDPESTKSLIKGLADARLLVVAGDEVEVAHEALIRHWERLRAWLNDDRDNLRLREGVSDDARRWENAQRDESLLNHRGARLELALAMSKNPRYRLNPVEQAYLDGCVGLREKERRANEILRRRIMTGLATGLVIALVLASFAIYQMWQAQRQTQNVLARQVAAQAHFIITDHSSYQLTAALLAIESMEIFPNGDAARYLLNNNFSAIPVSRMTHDDYVLSVAFSPDGRYVVSGSLDGTARVWDAASGKEIARMTHDFPVSSVAFSSDGKYVASGGNETARVWETATGKEIARMTHDDIVSSVAFSPDGKYVVSGSLDKTTRVWEAASGVEIARMTHDDIVSSVAFSPDGKYVVSGSGDKTARVWEAATGKAIARMTHDDSVSSVAFSPDGKYVASGSGDKTARVWEAASGVEIARMTHDDKVSSVVFSPNGKYVVSGSWDKTARVWETASGVEIARMKHDFHVFSVAFSPDGKYVVSGSSDGTARVWEAASGKEIARMTHDGDDDKTARVWETASGVEIAHMTHDDSVFSVAFSPDGKYVVSGSFDKTARVWEATSGVEIARMTHDDAVCSVAFSPDGRYVVSGGDDKTARVWEAASGKEIARITHDDSVWSVAFSPDGKYVVSGSSGGTARVWEAASGKEIARMTHDFPVSSVAFSPDGKYVVSGGDDGTARVWEAASGKEIARMTHDDSVLSVAFSPDGKYVVSGSSDGTARVWEATSGKEIARMTHDVSVLSVAFSPDGKYVVSGSSDGTARVWEAASGKEIARMTHDDSVWSVAFSPDGKYVVSGSLDKTARVWEWQTDDLITNACKTMPRNLTRAEWQQYIGDALPYQAVCPNLPIEPEPTAMPAP